jgi:hypothetical protein
MKPRGAPPSAPRPRSSCGWAGRARSGRPRTGDHRLIVAATLAPPPKKYPVTHCSRLLYPLRVADIRTRCWLCSRSRHRTGLKAVDRVPVATFARRGRSYMVRLVDHQQIDEPGVAVGLVQYLVKQSLNPRGSQPRKAGDHPRIHSEGVGLKPVAAAQLLVRRTVQDDERQPELVAHVIAPLQRQRSRQTTRTRRARCRRSISWITKAASIVLPRPTSSAISRATRRIGRAFATGSSSWSLI